MVTATYPKKQNWLSSISREIKARPSAMVLYGPPGIGKTTFGASSIKPVFMIDDQEDGINTLKAAKLIAAETPVLPMVQSWLDVMGQLDALATEDHEFSTLVIDTLGGLERLCHTHICETQFNGDWGDRGFASFAKGYEVSLPEWRKLLNALDKLRTEKSMQIIALSHSIVKPFKNPTAEDYDRYVVDMHHKTWAVTEKWVDMVFFANYFIAVDKSKSGRAKGKGGQDRVIHTEFEAAFDAKNRHALPPEISMGRSGQDAWNNLVTEIKKEN